MQELDALRKAIDEMQRVEHDATPDAALCEGIVELRRQIDRLESVLSRKVALAHERAAASADGYLSTAAFLRHACRFTPGAARTRVDVALLLRKRAAVAAAFEEGAISHAHASMLVNTLESLPAELASDAEPVLVAAARTLDTGRLAQAAKRLRYIIDPDGQAGVDERHHEARWLEVAATFSGMVSVTGLLDAESGAVLLTALESAMRPPGPDDNRTTAQRRADALVDIVRLALDHGDLPDVGGERPHVLVVSTLPALRREAGAPPAELGYAGSIGDETARRLSCDALVTRVVIAEAPASQGVISLADYRSGAAPPGCEPTGCEPSKCTHPPEVPFVLPAEFLAALPPQLRGPSLPLDVGRAERLATPAMRRALYLRDGGCAMPGCDCPRGWLEVHHIIHWADGGITAVWNLVLLCRRHHRFVHEKGWEITVRADGSVSLTPPLALTG
ncbi:MAG: hypothetical protein QOJ62_3028 [Actinomycetota bacterium]|nr:hypothetical protein [Actinomycetota bacterium]